MKGLFESCKAVRTLSMGSFRITITTHQASGATEIQVAGDNGRVDIPPVAWDALAGELLAAERAHRAQFRDIQDGPEVAAADDELDRIKNEREVAP